MSKHKQVGEHVRPDTVAVGIGAWTAEVEADVAVNAVAAPFERK